MATMTRALALALVLAAAGCGGPPQLSVRIESIQPWALRADAESRILGVADRAARFWGAAGLDDLNGYVVLVRDPPLDAYCLARVGGCTWIERRRIVISATEPVLGMRVKCAENTVLPHELGHAILRTWDHDDPRWALLPAWQQADVAEHPDCL